MTDDILEPLVYALGIAAKPPRRSLRLATVTNITSGVSVQFDEEGTASPKKYKRLASYTAVIGHRVLMAKVGSTWVILGQITT